MITGIFFDAHGVLYERHETTTPYARRLLVARGYPTEISPSAKQRLAAMREAASVGQTAPASYWDAFLLAHGVTDAGVRAEIAALILERPHEVFEMRGASATLRALKERRFVLGVITDTMYPRDWKMSWLAKIGVGAFLDVVVCSTTVGAHKPDPKIYLDGLYQAGLTPEASAFVGHADYELEGAHRVGMTTVAVNHAQGTQADYNVAALPAMLDLAIFKDRPS